MIISMCSADKLMLIADLPRIGVGVEAASTFSPQRPLGFIPFHLHLHSDLFLQPPARPASDMLAVRPVMIVWLTSTFLAACVI